MNRKNNKNMIKRTLLVIFMLSSSLSAGYCQDNSTQADAKVHYDLGNVFYQQGRFDDAQREYQKAMDILKTGETAGAGKRTAAVKGEPAVKDAAARIEPPAPAAVGDRKLTPAVSEYTISSDDVLKISVWQNADLDQEAIVRPDGMISFPLIGDVAAMGLTIPGLTADITRRLSEFVRSPQVSISLKKMGGSKVIVLGEILKPGVYSVTGAKTIIEAIAQSGGFTKDAVPSSIVLIRGGFAAPQPQRINLSKALNGKDVVKQNIVLQPEDVIFVPKKFIADLNYFLGQVLDPLAKGAYTNRELRDWNTPASGN